LEGATIVSMDKQKEYSTLFKIVITTRKPSKVYKLYAKTGTERNTWKEALEKTKSFTMSSKQLVEQWKKEDKAIRAVGKSFLLRLVILCPFFSTILIHPNSSHFYLLILQFFSVSRIFCLFRENLIQ
jgi:hypothetical protein